MRTDFIKYTGLGLLLLAGTLPAQTVRRDSETPLVRERTNFGKVADAARQRLTPSEGFYSDWQTRGRLESRPTSTMHRTVAETSGFRTLAPAELGVTLVSETDGFYQGRITAPEKLAALGATTARRGQKVWIEPRQGELVVFGLDDSNQPPTRISLKRGAPTRGHSSSRGGAGLQVSFLAGQR